jgi:hypothetical protein
VTPTEPSSPQSPTTGSPAGSSPGEPTAELGPVFERTFGEPVEKFLDLETWHTGTDLNRIYAKLQSELEDSIETGIAEEDKAAAAVRQRFFGELDAWPDKPPLAGRWQVPLADLQKVHQCTLFTGEVEACDGVVQVHDTLALTIMQFGVGLIGYRGDAGTWSCRLFRRDLHGGGGDPFEQAMDLLATRASQTGRQDPHELMIADLGRQGLATFAQRSVLARKCTAPWRMGRGSPAPFELLTGAGAMRLVESAVPVLRELLLEHRKFVFVSRNAGNRGLLTVGNALGPLEFAVVWPLRREIDAIVEEGHLSGEPRRLAQRFVQDAGREVVVGVLRASRWSPPRVFYAPAQRDLCAQAATIALADAVLQDNRGYPLLLEMARLYCASAFAREDFEGPVRAAYAARGSPAYAEDGWRP